MNKIFLNLEKKMAIKKIFLSIVKSIIHKTFSIESH